MGIQYGSTSIRDIKYCNAQGVLQGIDNVVRNGSSIWVKPQPVVYDGLKFTANTSGSTVALCESGSTYQLNIELLTSTDGETWVEYSIGDTITLPSSGDYVYFKAGPDGNGAFGTKYFSGFHYFSMTGSVAASGNVQSLFDAEMLRTTVPAYGLINLFWRCSSLTSAPELPATVLSEYCYGNMFDGCSGLVEAPSLEAESLAESCYNQMFLNCINITEAPELPASVLAPWCYNGMFINTGVVSVPKLSATTLANYCYCGMFKNCSRLKISENGGSGSVILDVQSGTTAPSWWSYEMFSNTAGSFTGDPSVGVTYYCYQ